MHKKDNSEEYYREYLDKGPAEFRHYTGLVGYL
jgi:hypothetical protein